MKPILTILFLLSFAVSTHAQNTVCRIYYDYDAAGNRVKRYYNCTDPNQVTQDPNTKPLNAILYSNPSAYIFNIDFQEFLFNAGIMIVTMNGDIVYTDEVYNAYRMTFDFNNAAPGEYTLMLLGKRNEGDQEILQTFKLVKR